MLTAQEIRKRYLEFFRRHGHEVVTSGPLIPPDDPTLLFANAGMVQFKKLFLGEEKREYSRAVTCQQCLRVSGKHNDLENVGRTARHHTFFEMLGNFSFGDYFKREAISWAWQFVTEELELPKEKLWVTIFRDDEEAKNIWQEVAGLHESRIVRMGEKDNFWTMGDTGPCGPCSEIYIDQGENMACGPDCGIGKCDCDRFLEIWNLVFTQFDQAKDGNRSLLAAPNIDTGMGLERIAAVCQGKRSNFDCDLFQEIIQYAASLAHVTYSFSQPDTNDVDTALRVIADHSRAAAFMIAGGVLPSNIGRGYVLRRLIRRALRFATLMGVHDPFMHKVARKVTEVMGEAWPDLPAMANFIERAVFTEEERFSLTLDKGLALLDEELDKLGREKKSIIPGDFCFRLYDTYGFPLDIVDDVAGKRGFTTDVSGFEENMKNQRDRARQSQKKDGLLGSGHGDESDNDLQARLASLAKIGLSSSFVGYDTLTTESTIIHLLDENGQEVDVIGEGESGYAICEKTPFYGESGGQAGDIGIIVSEIGDARVTNTIRPSNGLNIPCLTVIRGELTAGQKARQTVDEENRKGTARNHSTTHLLHSALRKVLGSHVKQAGSLVDGRRLRFDFQHIAALTQEEIAAVEREVNRAILSDLPVTVQEMAHDEAIGSGAMALFGEKYGEKVRVISIGDMDKPVSRELCGGTHINHTGEAGSFIILSETGVASGIRRIEAVTGWNSFAHSVSQRGEIAELCKLLKSAPDQLVNRVHTMQEDLKKARKASEKAQSTGLTGENLLTKAKKQGDILLLTEKLENVPVKAMRSLMDDMRSRLAGPSVLCLASVDDGKVSMIVHVTKDLHDRFTAPDLIKIVAEPVGGSGGGRPDLAQAGGNMPDGINAGFEALANAVGK